MSRVQEALEAWRRAARRWDAEREPAKRVQLEAEVDSLRRAYEAAVEAELDVIAHRDEEPPYR